MLLSDWRVLVRRWYVVAVGFPITFALLFLITHAVPVQYEADSKILMLPPEVKSNGLPTNPFLNLGGLDGMTDVLSSAMGDATIQKQLADAGHPDAKYTFIRDQTAAGPVVLLDVTAKSAADAMASQTWLLNKVVPVLAQLQFKVDVPPSTYITSTVFTRDDKPKVSRKTQLRLLLVAGVGGAGLTYLSAALVDGVARARRKPPAGSSQALSSPTSLRRPDVPQVPQLAGIPNPARQPTTAPAVTPPSVDPAPQPVGSGQQLMGTAHPDNAPATAPSGMPIGGASPARRPELQLKPANGRANGTNGNGKGTNGNGKGNNERDSGQGGLNWLP